VLKEAASFLERHGIESPRLNAERLIASILGTDRVGLYLRFDQPVNEAERGSIRSLLKRRASHEPLQYILGETEFLSLPFSVSSTVLIPRPETELLVEKTIERFRGRGPIRVLDIGTGSGCVAVALARALPEAYVDAVDTEPGALDVARGNAERNGVSGRIRFFKADLLAQDFESAVSPPYAALISNPPYVALREWNSLPPEIRNHEPRKALCDEGDGLTHFRAIASKCGKLLSGSGCVVVEIGYGQGDEVIRLFSEGGLRNSETFMDLNGIPRVVKAEA
jgi:release factor glutamine methyltransferase